MKHEKNGLIDSDCFMSRRDQIAATALQGMLIGAITSGESWTVGSLAQAAIESADALLERLDKPTGESYEAEHDQWISTTDRQPPSLEPGRFRKYLVSCNGQVFECSWLFGGWHKRHDGCSECHPDAWQYMPTPYQEKGDE